MPSPDQSLQLIQRGVTSFAPGFRKGPSVLVHEGKYVAEVDVQLIESEGEWAPYLADFAPVWRAADAGCWPALKAAGFHFCGPA